MGRPHQITLRSTKAGVQYQVIEQHTGEVPGRGVLSPRDKPVVINVKGPTELRSTFLEHLRVEIDGVPFPLPADVKGALPVFLPDPPTSPPTPRPVPASQGR
ncbi:MAG: hypothetical protein RLZZ178_795 [Verrucomicrobiota bacterium]